MSQTADNFCSLASMFISISFKVQARHLFSSAGFYSVSHQNPLGQTLQYLKFYNCPTHREIFLVMTLPKGNRIGTSATNVDPADRSIDLLHVLGLEMTALVVFK